VYKYTDVGSAVAEHRPGTLTPALSQWKREKIFEVNPMKKLSPRTLDKRFQIPRSAILYSLSARVANQFGAAIAERNEDAKIA
jgi:hypothetical protein